MHCVKITQSDLYLQVIVRACAPMQIIKERWMKRMKKKKEEEREEGKKGREREENKFFYIDNKYNNNETQSERNIYC